MPDETTPERPLGATPQLRESPWNKRGEYEVDWCAYLDNPGPADRLRQLGHRVTVVGPDGDFEGWGRTTHSLSATSFGAPEPWDSIMVALGTGSRVGWLYGDHDGAPFVTNGHGLFWTTDAVVKSVALLGVNKELPLDSFESWRRAIDGESWGDPLELDVLPAVYLDYSNFVRIGPAAVCARLVFAARHLGGTHALPSRRLGPIEIPGVGVLMPLNVEGDGEASS